MDALSLCILPVPVVASFFYTSENSPLKKKLIRSLFNGETQSKLSSLLQCLSIQNKRNADRYPLGNMVIRIVR